MYQDMIRRLTKVKFENYKSEILFRIMNCVLAYNSKNVISSILAYYLIDEPSRFGFSHELYYIPLKELKLVL